MSSDPSRVFSFRQPRTELATASAEVAAEGVTASLHRERIGVVWLRVEHEGGVVFEDLDESPLMTGRTRSNGPFFLVGSWADLASGVRRVRVEHGGDEFEPPSSGDGWLCLLPSDSTGPVSVVWLDESGREHLRSGDGPPLEDAGTLGPTYYLPLTDE